MTETRCRNCDTVSNFTIYENDKDVMQCGACHGFQYNPPISDLKNIYSEDYYQGDEYINYSLGAPVYKLNFSRKWKLLKKHIPQNLRHNIRILELGCASGDFLEVLKEDGIEHLMGAEVSDYSRQQAIKKGFSVADPLSSDYLNVVKKFNPNIIVGWDVWEHIETPTDIFNQLMTATPDLKLIALSTVNSGSTIPRLRGLSWRQFHPPTHLNYPTKKSFDLFFQNHCFAVLTNTAFGYYRPLADYLSALKFSPQWLEQRPGLFKIPIYLNLYDIQLVIAQKVT